MRVIGLTGGIGTGKSTVARMLSKRGAAVIDADVLAREVVEPGAPAFHEVVERFGRDVVDGDGRIDRERLGAVVFSDAAARADLERITHGRIGELMQLRIAEAMARDARLVVADIPLLYESRREGMFEGVLLVYAPRQEQVRRIVARDHLSEAAAVRRVDAQMPIEAKRELATWLIDNSGAVRDTDRQVARWWADEIGG